MEIAMIHLTVMEAICLAAILAAGAYAAACLRVLALSKRSRDGTTLQ